MTDEARPLTMQDRLLVAAHVQTLANQDSTLQVIADTVIECIRCCDYFPECAHVVDESERIDKEEGDNVAASLFFGPVDPDYACGATYCDDPACNTHGRRHDDD